MNIFYHVTGCLSYIANTQYTCLKNVNLSVIALFCDNFADDNILSKKIKYKNKNPPDPHAGGIIVN